MSAGGNRSRLGEQIKRQMENDEEVTTTTETYDDDSGGSLFGGSSGGSSGSSGGSSSDSGSSVTDAAETVADAITGNSGDDGGDTTATSTADESDSGGVFSDVMDAGREVVERSADLGSNVSQGDLGGAADVVTTAANDAEESTPLDLPDAPDATHGPEWLQNLPTGDGEGNDRTLLLAVAAVVGGLLFVGVSN